MDAVIKHGTSQAIELERPRWSVTEDGWDSGQVKWLVPQTFGFDIANYFARGSAHPRFLQMYVTNVDWIENGDDTWEADVTYKGLATLLGGYSKSYKRRISNYTQTTSGENIESTEWTGAQKAEVKEGLITVRDQYLSTTEPTTTVIGTAQTPADAPSTPTSPFSSVSDAIYLYPDGWVLEAREIDQIEGASVWFVIDTYVYYNAIKPGDI